MVFFPKSNYRNFLPIRFDHSSFALWDITCLGDGHKFSHVRLLLQWFGSDDDRTVPRCSTGVWQSSALTVLRFLALFNCTSTFAGRFVARLTIVVPATLRHEHITRNGKI